MKKILMFTVSALMAGLVHAEGEYLYWMVNVPPENKFVYAQVSVSGDPNQLLYNLTESEGDPSEAVDSIAASNAGSDNFGTKTDGVYAINLPENYLESTFVFELLDNSYKTISFKEVSGASLSSFFGSSMSKVDTPYTVDSVTQFIPEPTSGLLILFGLAGLALKRKQERA